MHRLFVTLAVLSSILLWGGQDALAQGQYLTLGAPPGGAKDVYADGEEVFATSALNGDIYQRFTNENWFKVGNANPNGYFAVDGLGRLFGGGPDGLWQYSGQGEQWFKIGGATAGLYAGGSNLYSVAGDGSIWKYRGTPDEWEKVGDAAEHFAVDGRGRLYGAGTNGVWRYDGNWTQIGTGHSDGVFVGTRRVFSFVKNHGLWEYRDSTGEWTQVAYPASQYLATRTDKLLGVFSVPDPANNNETYLELRRYTGTDQNWITLRPVGAVWNGSSGVYFQQTQGNGPTVTLYRP